MRATLDTPDAPLAPQPCNRLREGWVELLKGRPYDHFATLTFKRMGVSEQLAFPSLQGLGAEKKYAFKKLEREGVSEDFAFRRFENWINGQARITQRPIAWVAFPEKTHAGHVHLHALLVGTRSLSAAQMETSWRQKNGIAKIYRYEPDRGAEEYLTKGVNLDCSLGRLSSNFDRVARVRQGCA
jgi:hypothetical protein